MIMAYGMAVIFWGSILNPFTRSKSDYRKTSVFEDWSFSVIGLAPCKWIQDWAPENYGHSIRHDHLCYLGFFSGTIDQNFHWWLVWFRSANVHAHARYSLNSWCAPWWQYEPLLQPFCREWPDLQCDLNGHKWCKSQGLQFCAQWLCIYHNSKGQVCDLHNKRFLLLQRK